MSKPKILFMTPGLSAGGAEFWVVEMCRHLQMFGVAGVWQVAGTCHPEMIAQLRASGIPIIETGGKVDCDVVIAWGVPDPRKRIGPTPLPLISVSHGEWPAAPVGYFEDQAWQATHLVAVSRAAAEAFGQRFRAKATVIYNGVDPARLVPRKPAGHFREAWGVSDGHKVVVQVGRLEYEKRPDRLLDAADHLPDDWEVVFVGDGSQRDRCIADGRNKQRRITFQSYTTDMGDVYAAADVICLPSNHEGMPLTILEAWMCGVPVVATDFPFTGEMLGLHGDVISVVRQMHDPEELAAAIETTQIQDGMVARAKKVALEHYTVEAMVARWEKYLATEVFRYKAEEKPKEEKAICRVFGDDFFERAHATVELPITHGVITDDPLTHVPEFGETEAGELLLWTVLEDSKCPPLGNYVVGATARFDGPALVVINTDTMEQVAEYAPGAESPEGLADIAVMVARWFHNARLIWEINGPGVELTKRIGHKSYANVHEREEGKVGWWTNSRTKDIMFVELVRAVRSGELTLRSTALARECVGGELQPISTVYGDGHVETIRPPVGTGRLIATALCLQAITKEEEMKHAAAEV